MSTTTASPLEGIIITDDPEAGLVSVQSRSTLDIFTTPGVVGAIASEIRIAATLGFTPDLTTDKGRKEIASRAFRVAKAKTYLDDLGKEEVARLKELPKAVDIGRKMLRDALDALRDEIRQPLTAWEERREQLKSQIAAIQNLPAKLMACGSGQIRREIQALENWSTDAETWEEFASEAQAVKTVTLLTLEEMAEKAEKREKEAAELEALRAEKAERERKDREEQLRREGEERARQALAASSVPAIQTMPPAMVPMLEQAMDAAGVPQAPEHNPPMREAVLPPSDPAQEHRRAFNREALADIRAHVPSIEMLDTDSAEAVAKAILAAIVTGRVRHVSITY